MKTKLLTLSLFVFSIVFCVNGVESAAKRGEWFREARFGMFIHWGIYSIPAQGEWAYAQKPWKKGEYDSFVKSFNLTNYCSRRWACLA